MTLAQTTGLSISAWNPAIDMSVPSYVPRGSLVTEKLAETASAYSHTIQALGGWWDAVLSISLSKLDAEEWFENGLNRHIEVRNPGGYTVWAGFVNQVRLVSGTLTAVRGPLVAVANRVSVVYTPILDAATVPPMEGSETTTTIADDTTSQASYAILEEVITGGVLLDDGTTDDSIRLRDVYLQENKDPQTSEDLNLDAGAAITVTLDILGYVHRFQRYVYLNATPATVQVDNKLQAIITADPNGLFSTDYTQIAANPTLTSDYENDNRNAWDIMTQEIELGDVGLNRYTIGVYSEQQIVYAAIPTSALYQHAITSTDLQVQIYPFGTPVDPWDVQAAQWVFLPDFLTGRGDPAAIRDDPRFMFIETVRYAMPQTVSLNGQKIHSLPQLVARLAG